MIVLPDGLLKKMHDNLVIFLSIVIIILYALILRDFRD